MKPWGATPRQQCILRHKFFYLFVFDGELLGKLLQQLLALVIDLRYSITRMTRKGSLLAC